MPSCFDDVHRGRCVLSAFLVVAVIALVGTRASDGVRVKQQETILQNLPPDEARAYYQMLRARVRRVNVLRVIALASVVTLFYSYKHRMAAPVVPARAPTTTRDAGAR